jgi:outer membrane protein assembly factor BamB
VYIGSEDYLNDYDGYMYALNASTGALLWSYATGGRVDPSPAVANGVLYFAPNSDKVYAFGLK